MIRVAEVAFVGIPVTDMKRARQFYEGVILLKPELVFERDGKSWVEYQVGATTVGVSDMGEDWKSSAQGTSLALEVEDFDAAVHWLKQKHVPFTLEPFDTGGCRMAVVGDPDGNSITIHKRNPDREG